MKPGARPFFTLLLLVTTSPFLWSRSSGSGEVAPEVPQEIPFRLFKGHFILVEGSALGLRRLRLILDTGSSRSLISKRIVKKLGMKTYSQATELLAFGASTRPRAAVLSQLRVGSLLTTVACFVSDLAWLDVDVLLGMDVLARANLTIDYTHSTIDFGADQGFQSSVPFLLHEGRVVIELEISGQKVPVAVDTGTSTLVLKGESAERWANGPMVRASNDTVTGGRAARHRATYFREVRLGPEKWKRLHALLLYRWQRTQGTTGVVGPMGLGMERVHFDFDRRRLSWER